MRHTPPSITECLQLMETHAMLPNIREHSFIVARVAETILSRLASHSGEQHIPARDLVIAGALLHDIAKTPCLRNNCDHARVGSDICEQLGHPEVAEIVAEHVRLLNFEDERYQRGVFQAKEIIFYSDKRVVHDQIVPLEERLDYILEHYGNNDPERFALIRLNFSRCQNLESLLCKAAGCSAAELVKDVDRSPYSAEDS